MSQSKHPRASTAQTLFHGGTQTRYGWPNPFARLRVWGGYGIGNPSISSPSVLAAEPKGLLTSDAIARALIRRDFAPLLIPTNDPGLRCASVLVCILHVLLTTFTTCF